MPQTQYDIERPLRQEIKQLESEKARVIILIERWRERARNKFADAEASSGDHEDYERRFIEHGAMCYFNCASEIAAEINYESQGNERI